MSKTKTNGVYDELCYINAEWFMPKVAMLYNTASYKKHVCYGMFFFSTLHR